MAKVPNEVQLVITAKDLGTKKLDELVAVFEALKQAQVGVEQSSDRASKSLDELKLDLRDILTLSKDLSSKSALADQFDKLSEQAAKAEQRLDETRAALLAFQQAQQKGVKLTAEQREEQRGLSSALTTAEKKYDKAANSLANVATQLDALGLNSADARAQLRSLDTQVERSVQTVERQVAAQERAAAREKTNAVERKRLLAEQTQAEAAAFAQRRQAASQEDALARRTLSADQLRAREQQRLAQAVVAFTGRAQAGVIADIRRAEEGVERLRAARARLEQTRATQSGFGAFSQRATQVSSAAATLRAEQAAAQAAAQAQDQLAASQVRARAARNQAIQIEQRYNAVLQRLGITARQTGAALESTGQSARRAGQGVGFFADQGRKALSVYQRVRGQVLSLVTAYVGVFGAQQFAVSAINAQNNRLALQNRLLVANGNDTRAAADDFAFLRAEADRLGFSLNEIATSYSRLAIAGNAAGLSVEDTRNIFSSFAEVSRVNNLSIAETEGVFRALDQVLSKGKVQAEELRGQLGDRLSGAFTVFAQSLGKTNAELDALLERGEVSSRELIGFANEYRNLVSGQVVSASQTLVAELNRLKTAFDDFLIIVAEEGLADAVRDVSRELREFFKSAEGREAARQLGEIFRFLGEAALLVARNLDFAVPAIKTFIGFLLLTPIVAFTNAVVGLASSLGLVAPAAAIATRGLVALRTASLALLANPIFLAGAAVVGTLAFAFNDLAESQQRAKTTTDAMTDALNALRAARGTNEEDARRRHTEGLIEEARQRLAVARAALAQAEAAREVTLSGPRDPLGGNGGIGLAFTSRIERLRANIARAENDIREGTREIIGFGRGRRGGGPFRASPNDNRPADEPVVPDPNEVEARLKRIADLRAQADAAAVDELKALLAQLENEEETALAARLALINIEADERIAVQQRIAAEARTLGQESIAQQAELNIQSINFNRAAAIASEEKAAAEERATKAAEATREQYDAQQEALNRLVAQRDQQIENIRTQQELGLLSESEAQQRTFEVQLAFQDRIRQKVQELRDFLTANAGALGEFLDVETVLLGLDQIVLQTQAISPAMAKANELQQQFSQGVADSFAEAGKALAGFIDGTTSLSEAFKSIRDSFLNFIADFLIGIAKAIVQQIIFNALQKQAENSGGGGFWGMVAGAIVGSNHTGGIAGSGAKRTVNPWVFAGAPRYHKGGIAGLAPGEVPSILQEGEEVLTRDDPRHVANGGAAGGKMPDIKIVNAIDAGDMVSQGLNSRAGQQSILNFIRANQNQVRGAMGV
jgi:tape measure domain-containing protein